MIGNRNPLTRQNTHPHARVIFPTARGQKRAVMGIGFGRRNATLGIHVAQILKAGNGHILNPRTRFCQHRTDRLKRTRNLRLQRVQNQRRKPPQPQSRHIARRNHAIPILSHDGIHRRRTGNRRRQRPHTVQARCQWINALNRHTPMRRLISNHPTPSGRHAAGTTRIRANRHRHHPLRHRHGRTRRRTPGNAGMGAIKR